MNVPYMAYVKRESWLDFKATSIKTFMIKNYSNINVKILYQK